MDSAKEFEERIYPFIGFTDYCWYWLGYTNGKGYGRVQFGKVMRQAHRIVYAAMEALIPDGLVLDHLCRNTICVNPDHLEPVSNKENVLRGVGPTAKNRLKTHCKRGHELTPDNIYFQRPEWRRCLACKKQGRKEQYQIFKLNKQGAPNE